MKLTTIAKQVLGRQTPNAINEGQVLKGMVDGKPTYIIEHDGQELRVNEKDWKAFKDMISLKESVVTETVVYNSSNTKPEAAEKAKREFGKLLPKPNKGVEPYEFAVVKTKDRNYRLAIKSGSYVAHEFMTNLRDDGILTADIVKNAVANIIKMNPDEFNESTVNEGLMGDIHTLAQETSDVEDFITKFMADYGDIFAKNVGGFAGAKTPELKKWLTDLYADTKS